MKIFCSELKHRSVNMRWVFSDGTVVSFARVRLEGLSRGVTVLGIRGQSPPGTSDLAPDAHRLFQLKPDTLLVVLLTVTRRSTEI